MKVLSSHILIESYPNYKKSYVFTGVVEVTVSSSYELFTDIATITIPRKLKWQGKNIYLGEGQLSKYDRVVCTLGYLSYTYIAFKGYIRDIYAGTPIRLNCEDEIFLLKQKPITLSYKEVTLKKLLTDILPTTMPFEAIDVNLGQFRITRATPIQVLDEIKKSYGLYTFFQNGKLYSGLAYWPKDIVHNFKFTTNIIDGGDLDFRKTEDIKVKVKAIGIMPDNTRIEVERGDPEGEEITLFQYNVTRDDLLKFAENENVKYRYTGYKGSFMAFGEPYVQHGDIVKITDPDYPERDGSYFVKQVDYTFGDGITQKIYLGAKAV